MKRKMDESIESKDVSGACVYGAEVCMTKERMMATGRALALSIRISVD